MRLLLTRALGGMGILLAFSTVLFLIWLAYVSRLTAKNDSACKQTNGVVYTEAEAIKNTAELQHILDDYSRKSGNIGLQMTIVFPDNAVWHGTSGYASLEQKCRLTLDHHLYIGSMTKLYTAALVMDQVEQGTISLNDTVEQWVALPDVRSITIKMLLNHTSGIPSYTDDLWFRARYFGLPQKQWRPDELIAVIRRDGLNFEPGTQHEYTNSNYALLGVILEQVTGQTYQELLSALVVDKLGLHNTHFLSCADNIIPANGYDVSLLKLGRRNLTGFRTSMESGAFTAGGILSNSADVARFVHALFIGELLAEETMADMQTFIDAPDEDVPLQTGYGLGIRLLTVGGEQLTGHTGTIPGYSGIAMHNNEKQYTIVILSNLSTIEQAQLLMSVQEVILRMIM